MHQHKDKPLEVKGTKDKFYKCETCNMVRRVPVNKAIDNYQLGEYH